MSFIESLKNVRPFSSDAKNFSEEEISMWMREVSNDLQLLPPSQDEEYTKNLIEKLDSEPDIEIKQHREDNGVKLIDIGVKINDDTTMVIMLEYPTYQPNLVYFDCYPITYFGTAESFNMYAQEFMRRYPFILIGALKHEQEMFGMNAVDHKYTLRTFIPLLGVDNEYQTLKEAVYASARFAIDLGAGGYPLNEINFFINEETGINKNLSILNDIHKRYSDKLVSSIASLFGSDPLRDTSELEPASLNNVYLKEGKSDNYKDNFVHHVFDLNEFYITANKVYPLIWELKKDFTFHLTQDNPLSSILFLIGAINYGENTTQAKCSCLIRAYIKELKGDKMTFTISLVGCIPNLLQSKVIAWQMMQFNGIYNGLRNLENLP